MLITITTILIVAAAIAVLLGRKKTRTLGNQTKEDRTKENKR